ncbi:MAG: RagB/SusD family nutrient uptake outer membrane protein [Rikenellaceae bacterium]
MRTRIDIINKITVIAISIVVVCSCTDLEQIWYDQPTSSNVITTPEDVYSLLSRPYVTVSDYVVDERWTVNEESADQFITTTKGPHWRSIDEYENLNQHTWLSSDQMIWQTWKQTFYGIAVALETKTDLSNLDYSSVGLSEAVKYNHIAQLNVMIAYYYMRGLDFFGSIPIYTSTSDVDIERSSKEEVFNYIEELITGSIDSLDSRVMGAENEGLITKGSAAAILAQLYFNANTYIGESRDSECRKVVEDIISGSYGDYALATDWKGPFDFDNKTSDELLWAMPSKYNYLQYDWFYYIFYHFSAPEFFDFDLGAAWNGCHMQPSLDPAGNLYTFNIGMPFSRFHSDDLRKKQYSYSDGKDYDGMMLFGAQFTPDGSPCLCIQEYAGSQLVFVDQVARFSEMSDPYSDNYGKTYANLESNIHLGEENSGIRMVKIPIPDRLNSAYRWASHNPIIRLTEIYFMWAELEFNEGNVSSAADIINNIRKRNFTNGVDPDKLDGSNLDKYRLAQEWGNEFLGEGRRRTDLIRWNMFHTEDWWSHTAHNNSSKNVFPIPDSAIFVNNKLTQNSGY